MPHRCATLIPIPISRSIIALGAAEPPILASLRWRGVSPVASICAKVASQTVGTPEECVTFSRFIRPHSTAASLTAEKTNFAPAIAPAKGRPQQAAWNIGTTGSTTAAEDRSNTAGATSAMAWRTVERCSYSTPLGWPVVPLV